jgi:hypothetical protein
VYFFEVATMSIPLMSLNSLFTNITQSANQVRGDHTAIAQAGQMGEQAVKKSKTDTVTISKKAIQMVSTAEQSSTQGSVSEKPVDQAQGTK